MLKASNATNALPQTTAKSGLEPRHLQFQGHVINTHSVGLLLVVLHLNGASSDWIFQYQNEKHLNYINSIHR